MSELADKYMDHIVYRRKGIESFSSSDIANDTLKFTAGEFISLEDELNKIREQYYCDECTQIKNKLKEKTNDYV